MACLLLRAKQPDHAHNIQKLEKPIVHKQTKYNVMITMNLTHHLVL